jgi:hypothetical protein
MLKNIHPSQISFNKARNYYLSNKHKTYKIILTKEIVELKYVSHLIYQFKCENGYLFEVMYSEWSNEYSYIWYQRLGDNIDFMFEWALGEKFTIDMSENYKLITMLICNKYLTDNGMKSNKVLNDKYLMRFIASYL